MEWQLVKLTLLKKACEINLSLWQAVEHLLGDTQGASCCTGHPAVEQFVVTVAIDSCNVALHFKFFSSFKHLSKKEIFLQTCIFLYSKFFCRT